MRSNQSVVSRDQSPLVSSTSTSTRDTMAVWADNIKFVKDIIDTKFGKIDQAVQEVGGLRNSVTRQ